MHWIAGLLVVGGGLLLPLAATAQTTSNPHKPVHKAVTHPAVTGAAAKGSAAKASSFNGRKPAAAAKRVSTGTASRLRGRKRVRRAAARSYQLHPDPERYQQIQQALAERGFYKGQPDGTWNDNSVEALRSFQTANQLDADGKISALTLMKLGLGPKHDGSAAPLSGARPDTIAPPPDSSASETPLPPPPTSLPPETPTETIPQ